MNWRLTLGLVILLLALGSYVYFGELNNGENSRPAAAGVALYPAGYDEYDLVTVDITGPAGAARFARTTGSPTRDWAMLLPVDAPPEALDQARINGVALRLARLTADQVITGATNLAQYGLEPPLLTASLTISSGQALILHAGAPTPVGDNRYVRLAGDATTVYTVFGFAVEDAGRLIELPPFAPAASPRLTLTPQ